VNSYYTDLHIHIGRTSDDKPVKITASRDLTFGNICRECVERKGIQVAGIIDCASPGVLADIDGLVADGEMRPLTGGGLLYRELLVVILGSELETQETAGRLSHHIGYFPDLESIRAFSATMSRLVKNLQLSSQQCHLPADQFVRLTAERGGFAIPAHAFTPHKSLYGSCAASISGLFSDAALEHIPAIELGLSADSSLADRIPELAGYSFLSNSDAHSLPRIGREYNVVRMREASFAGLRDALYRLGGASVVANFGLDPRLGKYHRTFCEACLSIVTAPPPTFVCPSCGSDHVTPGVLDRIVTIAGHERPAPPDHRPPYTHQVPLQFVPGLGSVKLNALLNRFGTEMAVLHDAEESELQQVVGIDVARRIMQARDGTLPLQAGGGGQFGKALTKGSADQLSLGI